MNKKLKFNLLVSLSLLVILPFLLFATKVRKFILPEAQTPQAQLRIEPSNVTKRVGESINLTISLSVNQPVSAVNLSFSFNPVAIELLSVSTNQEKFTDDLSAEISQNPLGKVSLSLVSRQELLSLPTGNIPIGSLLFRGKAAGNTNLLLDNTSQAVGPGEEFSLFQINQSQLPSITILPSVPQATVTPTIGPNPQISFSLKLNGITKGGPPLPVRVRLVESLTSQARDFTVTLASNSQGVYQTNGWLILSGILPNKDYNILVKGPKHLQRRVETRRRLLPGEASQNQFNWTNKPLEPGDLPNPNQGGTQDGVVNSIDASLILDRFGLTDAVSNSVADLNFDSVVNLNDFSLLIATLSEKGEDED